MVSFTIFKASVSKILYTTLYCCEQVKSCIFQLAEDKFLQLYSKTKNERDAAPHISPLGTRIYYKNKQHDFPTELKSWGARGGVVVKALCYKPAGRRFNSSSLGATEWIGRSEVFNLPIDSESRVV